MNNSLPKISIIVPTYNTGGVVDNAIKSIVDQSYQNFEIVIVDGGSKDSTLSVIEKWHAKYPKVISFITESDKGIYDAMNKGLILATGKYVHFLGSDDKLNDKEVLSDVFSSNEDSDLIYGNVVYSDEKPGGGKYDKIRLMNNNIPHQAIFYKKELVESMGGFELKYKIQADHLLNVRFFSNPNLSIKYIDRTIAYFSLGGLSSNKLDIDYANDAISINQKYFGTFYKPKQIVQYSIQTVFLQLKYGNFFSGFKYLVNNGLLISKWKDFLYCILVRFNIKKENWK